jgi:hypothetical protein
MIIGAEKSGTSSLARYLEQHPNICSHERREMNYFVNDKEYAQGYDKIYSRYFSNCKSDSSIVLAKSVGVMYWPFAVKRLWNHNPECQLVAILRNPVDRAYSAYWYARRMGWEDLESFEEAIEAEPIRLKENGRKRQQCTYLDRGIYHKQLAVLFEHFASNQVHIFLFEDLKNNPVGICQNIYKVIGIDSDYLPDVSKEHNKAALPRFIVLSRLLSSTHTLKQAVRNLLPDRVSDRIRDRIRHLNEKAFLPPPMNQETRAYLEEYFSSHNNQLRELMERDLSHWMR